MYLLTYLLTYLNIYVAVVDVEYSHVRFLGNLVLNLWDCGGYVILLVLECQIVAAAAAAVVAYMFANLHT